MRILSTLLLLLHFVSYSFAQRVVDSKRGSTYTYIFKASDQLAARGYRKDFSKYTEADFKTLVDSIHVDSLEDENKILPIGHYLFVKGVDEQAEIQLRSYNNVEAKVLNNERDLIVVVYDSAGKECADARVSIRNKKLKYDKKTKTYRLKNANKKGVLSVEFQGHISYFNVEKHRGSHRSLLRKISYKPPIKYVLWPFRYVYRGIKYPRSFLDPIRSISRFIYNITHPESGNKRDYTTGYFVFNKPKYLPKDTVRFKALVLTRKGKPYRGKLDAFYVVVNVLLDKKKLLKTLDPATAGAYVHEFILPDSLTLDKSYRILLMRGKKIISENTFKLEDYELDEVNYSLRVSQTKYYLGEPVTLFAQGINSFGKNMMDGKVKLTIATENIANYSADRVFVPDVIWETEKTLDLVGETEIAIPDSLIPKGVQMTCSVKASFINSSNELQEQSTRFEILTDEKRIVVKVNADFIEAEYRELSTAKTKKGTVEVHYANNMDKELLDITFPYKATPKPLALLYYFKTDSTAASKLLAESPSYVGWMYTKTNDTIKVELVNPRKLQVKYFIYKGNRELYRGHADSLTMYLPMSNGVYTASLQYVWGGVSKDEDYTYYETKKQLNVALDQPFVVYPGQHTDIKIKVTDYKNKPVPNTNLTAFSINSQFQNTNIPRVPAFPEKIGKGKLVYRRYNDKKILNLLTERFLKSHGLFEKLHVDTNVYYNFLFPGNKLFRQYSFTQDSVTQFSPYVIHKGIPQKISLVYCDNELVYFDKTDNIKQNAFRAEPGYHQIKLRLADRQITINALLLEEKQKLIFSLDLDSLPENCTETLLANKFTPVEKEILENHVFILGDENSRAYNREFVWQNTSFQITQDAFYRDGFKLMGPFPIYSSLHYSKTAGLDSKNFKFEPGFAYYFDTEYFKMKSANLWDITTPYVENGRINPNFRDSVLLAENILNANINRQQVIDPAMSAFLQSNLIRNNNYNEKHAHLGSLEYESTAGSICKYIVLTHYSSSCYFVVYANQKRAVYNIPAGLYKVGFIYYDGTSQVVDKVHIKLKGVNFLRLTETNAVLDTFDLFLKHFKISCSPLKDTTGQSKELNKKITTSKKVNANGMFTVSGSVLDKNGEPIIGATVEYLEKGRRNTGGTVTDIDGIYTIEVSLYGSLKFSFLGNKSLLVPITRGLDSVNVSLAEDAAALEEVVTMGYSAGYSRRKYSKDALQGRSTGVQNSSGSPGASSTIRIRGVGSTNGGEPLYVIDGKIVTSNDLNLLNPNDIVTMDIMKAETAAAIYGARAASGVVIITTKNGGGKQFANKSAIQAQNKDSMPDLQSIPAGIRSDFRDYGYWKPNMVTDANGEAKFKVTFPGNVTSWNTNVLAVDFKKKSGSLQQTTRAFKPLMAELATPRFLIEGDEATVIGKVSNYTGDTVNIRTSMAVDSSAADTANLKLVHTQNLYHKIVAGKDKDTIAINFNLKYNKYQDGELRKIPVFRMGVEESKGIFLALDKDTSFNLDVTKFGEMVEITATDNPIKVLREEINHVRNYEYLCSEQLSSKLLACLHEKIICTALDEKFKFNKDISKLINKLGDHQLDDGTWGWWNGSRQNFRMTACVFKALAKAEKMGYSVPFLGKTKEIMPHLLDAHDANTLLVSLNTLADLDIKLDYAKYLKRYDTLDLSMHEKMQIIALKQKLELPYNLSYLKENKKETIFGAQYWGEEGYSWYDNAVRLTLEAYKILKKQDSTDVSLRKIRQYFFERRLHNGWRNTYESASVIETILIDVLKENSNSKIVKSSLVIAGTTKDSITTFPYHQKISSTSSISITKRGTSPIFFSAYTKQWNNNPSKDEKNFEVTSFFENKNGQKVEKLKAGEAVTMIVTVKSKKSFEYIMIEIPIPAGCTYGNNDRVLRDRDEIHREYFKHKTAIFAEKMSEGTHTYKINLEPRYTGKYTLNPAKIELMYFPIFYGREGLKKMVIE